MYSPKPLKTRVKRALQTALAVAACSSAQAYTVYDGPIEPVPMGCVIEIFSIPDSIPKIRPVFQLLPQLSLPAKAVVNPNPFPRLLSGYRQVDYSYNFSRLDLKIPNYLGLFSVSRVQATVFKGPTAGYPIASDQVRTDRTGAIAWTSSTVESQALVGKVLAFQNKWLIRVVSTGLWKDGELQPLKPASVTIACTVTVEPPPVLVLQ